MSPHTLLPWVIAIVITEHCALSQVRACGGQYPPTSQWKPSFVLVPTLPPCGTHLGSAGLTVSDDLSGLRTAKEKVSPPLSSLPLFSPSSSLYSVEQ